MPSKQMYIDGANGTVSIVSYANATNARTNPSANLDDVFFHTNLDYLQLKSTIGPTSVVLPKVDRQYYTWSDGGGCGGGLCFITSAVTESMGLPDDCDELVALRNFRDRHMLATFETASLVADYYLYAPEIVRKIGEREDSKEIYSKMYKEYILPSVDAIERLENEEAVEIYKRLVQYACEVSGVEIGVS